MGLEESLNEGVWREMLELSLDRVKEERGEHPHAVIVQTEIDMMDILVNCHVAGYKDLSGEYLKRFNREVYR
jgi:hypothetical protein